MASARADASGGGFPPQAVSTIAIVAATNGAISLGPVMSSTTAGPCGSSACRGRAALEGAALARLAGFPARRLEGIEAILDRLFIAAIGGVVIGPVFDRVRRGLLSTLGLFVVVRVPFPLPVATFPISRGGAFRRLGGDG